MTEPLFGVWVTGPAWPKGTWCMSHRKRVELPREAAAVFALEGRTKYPDHSYTPRPLLPERPKSLRAHLLRAHLRLVESLP